MRHPRLVLAIFILSGAAGLMYEVVWSRQLVLVFGNGACQVDRTDDVHDRQPARPQRGNENLRAVVGDAHAHRVRADG